MHIETVEERDARLKKFLAMTDAENAANIASDPDAQVPNDSIFLAKGVRMQPDKSLVFMPLVVDRALAERAEQSGVDYQVVLPQLLSDYLSSHTSHPHP